MKKKISITVDSDLLERLDAELKSGLFRNKSHLIEYSVRKFLGGGK